MAVNIIKVVHAGIPIPDYLRAWPISAHRKWNCGPVFVMSVVSRTRLLRRIILGLNVRNNSCNCRMCS